MRFVTKVLRGLVSLSKENPIWTKEPHRPPKKQLRRKRRAVKRSRTPGRRSLVRAVRISDHWSPLLFIHSFFNVYIQKLAVCDILTTYLVSVQRLSDALIVHLLKNKHFDEKGQNAVSLTMSDYQYMITMNQWLTRKTHR